MATRILKSVLWLLVRFLHVTYRYRYFSVESYRLAASHHSQRSFVIGLFHCNALAGLLAHRGLPFSPLISQSRDGELIAHVSDRLGLPAIRGSSSKGAVAAQRQLARIIASGRRPAYTVDGPQGPRFRVKSGVIAMAAKNQIAALPMAAIADRFWEFRSWDRFRLPKPFARIVVLYAAPLFPVSEDARDLVVSRQRFQEQLLELEGQAAGALDRWNEGLRLLPF